MSFEAAACPGSNAFPGSAIPILPSLLMVNLLTPLLAM